MTLSTETKGHPMELHTDKSQPLQIGPLVRHEIGLRIAELRQRHKPSSRDLRELSQLEEFLRTFAPREGKEAGR
jgi:hypothetical protein